MRFGLVVRSAHINDMLDRFCAEISCKEINNEFNLKFSVAMLGLHSEWSQCKQI